MGFYMDMKEKFTVEVCFSPQLYDHKLTKENFITVVVDILRATTSICAAFENGVKEIIPVGDVDEARKYKHNGHIVACERDGKVLSFADIGNSASEFLHKDLIGKTVVFSTTNGTKSIKMARDAEIVVAGSFVNISSLAEWLNNQGKNVVIFCAAWKNRFNLEDSVFSGALSEKLLHDQQFVTNCDSTLGAIDLWQHAKENIKDYLSKSSHRNRLKHLVSDEDFKYTLTADTSKVVPVLEGDRFIGVKI